MIRRSPLAAILVLVLLLATTIGLASLVWMASHSTTTSSQFLSHSPVLRHTLVVGLVQAVVLVLLSLGFAGLALTPVPGRRLLHQLLLAPLVFPPFSMALGLMVWCGRSGILAHRFGLELGFAGLAGLATAGVLCLAPVAYLLVLAAMRTIDRSSLDVARTLGLPRRSQFRLIVWPQLAPVLGAVALLGLVEAMTELVNPIIVGGNYTVLPTRIWIAVSADMDWSTAALLGLLLLIPGVLLAAWVQRLSPPDQLQFTLTPAMSSRAHPALYLGGWLLGLLNAVLLATVLVGAVVESVGVVNTPTMRHLRAVVAGGSSRALSISVALAAAAAPIAGVVALALLWLQRAPMPRWLRYLLHSCLAVWRGTPGLVVGLAATILLVSGSLHIHVPDPFGWGAALALLLVEVCVTVPAIVAALEPTVAAHAHHAHDVGSSLSLTAFQRARTIWAPLLAVDLAWALGRAFITALTVISPVLFLTNSRVGLASIDALASITGGRMGTSCAIATLLFALSGLVYLTLAWAYPKERA